VAAEPLFPRPRPRRRAENLPSAGPTPSVALRRARTNASSGARATGRHCSHREGRAAAVTASAYTRLWRRGGQMHARTHSSSRAGTRAREQSHKRKCAHARKPLRERAQRTFSVYRERGVECVHERLATHIAVRRTHADLHARTFAHECSHIRARSTHIRRAHDATVCPGDNGGVLICIKGYLPAPQTIADLHCLCMSMLEVSEARWHLQA
jgi:hypothetical protein